MVVMALSSTGMCVPEAPVSLPSSSVLCMVMAGLDGRGLKVPWLQRPGCAGWTLDRRLLEDVVLLPSIRGVDSLAKISLMGTPAGGEAMGAELPLPLPLPPSDLFWALRAWRRALGWAGR